MKKICQLALLGIGLLALSLTISPDVFADKSGVSPTVLSLPSGPGSIGGVGENVQANLNMGLMSYNIKVLLPQGRVNATPSMNITYSSSAGAGRMGIGWSMSAGGAVERHTARGLPTYTNEDRFDSGGELVKIPNSPFYRARIEGGFVRYRWVQKDGKDQEGYWIAEYPNGSKGYFGATSKGDLVQDAQVYGLKGTFRWELVHTVDKNGNKIEYTYFKDGTQTYLDTISWVFDGTGKPLYQARLSYEDRPDPISDGKPGFDLRITKRLKGVEITSAGQRFRSYQFTFEDSTGLSRLINVKRFGREASKSYPVEFTMKYSDATFSTSSKMVTMKTPTGLDFRSQNADLIDINGDGLPDIIDTTNPKHVFHINELKLDGNLNQISHDFPRSLIKENPNQTSAQLKNPSVQMLDFNGDGFTDLVDAVNKQIYINKGNTKWENGSESLQSFSVNGKDLNMRFMDYNGDKKIDVISSDGNTTHYWVSDGKGNWVSTPGKTNIGLGFNKDKLRLIDINGDGLQDVVHITKNSLRYRKYLGYGEWTPWIDVKVPEIDKYELSTKAQFADLNGDGMADMVAFLGNNIAYFVNKNGVEFEKGVRLQKLAGVDIPDSTQTTVRIADINGNGSRDIIWINSSGQVTYLELFNKRPNLMTEISNGIGQRINVAYGSSVNYFLRDKTCDVKTDKVCAGPWQNKMPMPFTVVTDITTWASHSANPLAQKAPATEERPSIQKIYYHDGFYDGKEKQFRGFRKVESVLVGDSSIEGRHDFIEFNVGDTDSYFHGKILRSVVKNDKGSIFFEDKMEWKDCGTPAGADQGLTPPVRFICMASKEVLTKEGTTESSRWKTTRQESTYDGYGNLTVATNLGEKGKDGDESIVKTTFITPKDPKSKDSPWFLRLRQKVEHCNKTAPHCAEIRYFYDGEGFKGLPLGQFTKGNITRIAVRRSTTGDDFVTTLQKKYDEYGNFTEIKNSKGLIRAIKWDEQYNRFSTTETLLIDGKKLTANTRWNYALSQVAESTSYNGHITTYGYDSFGRILWISLPEDAKDKPSITYTYELKAPINRVITRKRTTKNGPSDVEEVQCFDGLGRKFSTANKLGDNKYLITKHHTYNARNKVGWAYYSYPSDKPCQWAPPAGTRTTKNDYDALGRNIKRTLPDGNFTRTLFAPFQVSIYDEEDNKKDSPHFDTPKVTILDGLGRIKEIRKMLKKDHLVTTKYEYTNINAQGKSVISRVTFPDGSKKTHEFNLLGQIVKVNDPDRGSTEITLDTEGNVTLRKEANGTEIAFTYDQLNRILTQQEKGKPETKITYQYDAPNPDLLPTATNVKAKVVSIQFPGGSYAYSYDNYGNLDHVVYRYNGQKYTFKRKFDNSNRMLEETYPDGRKLTYKWDIGGRLTEIPGFLKLTYNDEGLPASRVYGNGVSTQYTFDMRSWPVTIDANNGKVMRLKYGFDSNGNILSIEHKNSAGTSTNKYTYDALYRLTQADLEDGQENIKYTFDDLHNIKSRSSSLGDKSPIHLGDYTYDKAKIHAVTEVKKRKLAYDKIGCMTTDNNRTYKWDYLHRRTHVLVNGEVRGRSMYGPDSHRMLKEENGVHTLYVTRNYQIRDGKAVIYVALGGDRIAAWSIPMQKIHKHLDLAPAKGDSTLTSTPDGLINAADAWLYHASRNKLVGLPHKENPLKLDETNTLLRASVTQMLMDDPKEETHYYHADHQGSILAVTDNKGAVISEKTYYPYGYLKKHTGQIFSYGYMGTERDELTKMNYVSSRFMDTHLAKWQSPDPMFDQITGPEDEFNSYGITRANPIRYRDYDGTDSTDTLNLLAQIYLYGSIAWAAYKVKANHAKLNKDMYKSGNIRGVQAGRVVGKALKMFLSGFAVFASFQDDPAMMKATLISTMIVSTVNAAMSTYVNLASRKYLKKHNQYSQKEKGLFRLTNASNAIGFLGTASATAGMAVESLGGDESISSTLLISGIVLGLAGGGGKKIKGTIKNIGKLTTKLKKWTAAKARSARDSFSKRNSVSYDQKAGAPKFKRSSTSK